MGTFQKLVLSAATCAALLWAPSAAHAQSPPPVEAFGSLPAISDVAISPDGGRIALARFVGNQSGLTIYDLDSRRDVYSARIAPDQQLRGVGWADDHRVMIQMSITVRPHTVLPAGVRFSGSPRRIDYWRTGVISLPSGATRYLSANDDAEAWADQGSRVYAPIESDPGYGRIFGWSSPYSPRTRLVYRINLDTGRATNMRVRGANNDTLYYIIDDAGEVAIRADSRERSNHWRIFTYDGEEPRLLLEDVSETGAPIDVAGLMADGRLGILDWDETGEHQMLIAVDRNSGARETIFRAEQGSVGGSILDPWSRRIVGVYAEGIEHYFDADLAAVSATVSQRIPDESSIVSWSRDRRRFIVYGERGLDGGGYYLFEPADNRWALLGMLYPQVATALQGAQRQEITYRARDGVRVPAYLTLPPGVTQARNAPLVLLVHGGPHSRDTMSFDWWASFLASRGYVVLQPNFRGSTGYGRSWQEAGRRQWGGLMQTDVEDGVAALIRNGMVDPARVCIVGASYGGYAALAGATLTPERYACAVGVAGVYDLVEMLQQERRESGSSSLASDWWALSIGDLRTERDRIAAVSPINLAQHVRVPVLLMHGTDDSVVPIQQSRAMERRLRDAGKQVRYVELTGDDHWLSDAPTRISMLRELESFLAQHLAVPPAAQ